MNVTDYDNMTDDYKNSLSKKNCTNNESDIDIIIPMLILTMPYGLPILCLMSLMMYTLIEPLFNIK